MLLAPPPDAAVDEFEDLRRTADQVTIHEGTQLWGRLGLLGRGVAYGLAAAAALELTWNGSGTPTGRALLGALAAVVGVAALWHLGVALWGDRDQLRPTTRLAHRAISAVKGLFYGGVALLLVAVLAGEAEGWTADALVEPGGRVLAGAAAAFLFTLALWCFPWSSEGTLESLGLAARAAVVALLGYLVLDLSIQSDGAGSAGLGQALAGLVDDAFGRWTVTAIAVGLACYGLSSWIQAARRHM